MKKAPIALLFALCSLAILPLPANAIPIHRHVTVPRVVGHDPDGPLIVKREVVRVVNVAPSDSDQDGCPDTKDSYEGPGCNAPAPPSEPTPTAASTPYVASAPTTTSVAPSAAGTPPAYIAQCESGGSYTAVNPSSGAYGKWQILPSTSAAYGCDMSSPAGQDACAAEIYSDVGSSAWVCAG